MSIRTRLMLWYSVVLLVALAVMGVMSYFEFVVEPEHEGRLIKTPVSGEDADESPAGDAVEIGLWCAVPALALALGGGWWIMRRALAPVAALTEAAERINEHNLGERLPRTGSGDELDRLTGVFNDMTGRLDSAFTRMREFMLHASHELKTPLAVMHGELENWLQDERLTADQRERVTSKLDEVQRLTQIVDGLTLLTKADAGQVALARELVKLDELVREAAGDAQSLGRPRNVEVTLGACSEATVAGDRHRLRQLLLNLCDNAVKYCNPGGKVTLELRTEADSALVRITNTGPGIRPDILPRIFDPLFRGDPGGGLAVDGCGLGLSIARWIATAHGGTIDVASDQNVITRASVRLPLAPPGPPEKGNT